MTHGTEKFYETKRLAEQDLSDYAIARLTGVSRPTVQRWRHRTLPPGARYAIDPKEWQMTNPEPYCYLLGVYLGDGNILHRPPNGWTLRVACDQRYPEIEAEVMSAMRTTFPKRSATRRYCSAGASDIVQISHPWVGQAFPQHGAGRKHLRRITLTAWQLELTRSNPSAFVRGLIHSDGCRSVNSFQVRLPSGRLATYSYVRYFFTNLSPDIRQLFVDHCRLLGVRVTQPNERNLAISDRPSVATLDRFVGPKR